MQYLKEYEYSPELLKQIVNDAKETLDKYIIQHIVDMFIEAGFTIKVKHVFPETPKAYYRILCFIKKSAESVIINTRTDCGKEGVVDGLNIQIRILNQNTLDNLQQLNERIRQQILHEGDCHYCSDKCDGKRYLFSYDGVDYAKCQYLCSNFRFTIETDEDMKNILDIVRGEISYKKPKKSPVKNK